MNEYWVLFEEAKEAYKDYYYINGVLQVESTIAEYIRNLPDVVEVFGVDMPKEEAVKYLWMRQGAFEIDDVICFDEEDLSVYLDEFSDKIIRKSSEEIIFKGSSLVNLYGSGIFHFYRVVEED